MTSILNSAYTPTDREFSDAEIQCELVKLRQTMKLSLNVYHDKCKHRYRVLTDSKKEREMIEQRSYDVGNCSVCWKYYNTPSHLKKSAMHLVEDYMDLFSKDNGYLSEHMIFLMRCFYIWLYIENYPPPNIRLIKKLTGSNSIPLGETKSDIKDEVKLETKSESEMKDKVKIKSKVKQETDIWDSSVEPYKAYKWEN